MNFVEALEQIKFRIQADDRFIDFDSVEIYVWRTPLIGVRVSEVSFLRGRHGGCSWMDGNPDGLLVCALVERAVLARTEKMPDAEIDDADHMLLDFLFR